MSIFDRSTTRSDQSLLIADSLRVNAEALAWSLRAFGSFDPVSCVHSVEDLRMAVRSTQPSVIVLNESLAVPSLREVCQELPLKFQESRLAVFADLLTDRQLDLMTHNPISGLLSRDEPLRSLNDQLSLVASGTPVVSENLKSRVQIQPDGTFACVNAERLQRLTDRQWDVLLRIAKGNRVADVANDLHISKKSVEAHKYRIMRVLGASDRVELCRWAIREGLIEA